MDSITVIHGTYADDHFVPDVPAPRVRGRAELIVYPESPPAPATGTTSSARSAVSIFDLLGKAAILRSGEDIDAQLEMERRAWDED